MKEMTAVLCVLTSCVLVVIGVWVSVQAYMSGIPWTTADFLNTALCLMFIAILCGKSKPAVGSNG